ncbi:F-actin-uncapping protein LRRC16A [Characodon lateralis]|uniref:F-actin-uncapping protein LRRC16A n=1 Tax=Characodon lateralis TaxID=208331 RepID=A0ABU7CT91_9TELE|nr:F-actin-uncapping protein LRRC16A [Characodon lateralis]
MMSEESSDVPKELLESVRDAVGRKVNLSLRKKVKLEIKGDKTENRVLNTEERFRKENNLYLTLRTSSTFFD